MTDYRKIYSECISDLHDKKQTLRESAIERLIPHLTENDTIHNYIQGLSDALLTASEKGLLSVLFARAFVRLAALNPTLNCYKSVITYIIKHLKHSQDTPDVYAELFSALGLITCMVSNFNEIFDDLSDVFYVMVDSLTQVLTKQSPEYLHHSTSLVYGLSAAYLGLPDNHRSGWAYDRYIPLMIYFMTRNPELDVTLDALPHIISGLLAAVQSSKLRQGGLIHGSFPPEFCSHYQLETNLEHDDGYYTLDGERHVYIPLIHYTFDHLLKRIKMIFDQSSISLDNDYQLAELEDIQEMLDDLFQYMQTDSVRGDDIADNLATHRNHDFCPDRYSTIEGRIIYHGLEKVMGLPWDDVAFMPYMGEMLSGVEILANLEPQEKAEVDKHTRRVTQKQRDIQENAERQMKYAYLYQSDE